jgi:hypothetical protein
MIIADSTPQEKYAQCEFTRGGESRFYTVGFIPIWAAKVGNMVQLVDLDGQFWKIEVVGAELDKDKMRTQERGFKNFQVSTRGRGIDQ